MNKTIGVLGCGWLGTPLAESLIRKGYGVRGSTTREEKVASLLQKNIEARVLRLGETDIKGDIRSFLEGLDALVVNIPPGMRANSNADFTARIQVLESYLQKAGTPHLVFVSSTSVYGDAQENVGETDLPLPDSQTGRHLLEAETILRSNTARSTQILRPGGLLGTDRHPIFSLSGKQLTSDGNARVNLVRRQDVLRILELLIANPANTGVFNAVFPEHPSKREFYTTEASYFGIPPPCYIEKPGRTKGKEIHSRALQEMGYRFTNSIWTQNPNSKPGTTPLQH